MINITKNFLILTGISLVAFSCSESENNRNREAEVLGLLSGLNQRVSEPTVLQTRAIEVAKDLNTSQLKEEKEALKPNLESKLNDLFDSSSEIEKSELKSRLFSIAEKNGEVESMTKLINSPSEEFMKTLFKLQNSKLSENAFKNTRANGHWVCLTVWWGPVALNNDFWVSSFLCSLVPHSAFYFQTVNSCTTSGWIWGCN